DDGQREAARQSGGAPTGDGGDVEVHELTGAQHGRGVTVDLDGCAGVDGVTEAPEPEEEVGEAGDSEGAVEDKPALEDAHAASDDGGEPAKRDEADEDR